MGWVLGRFRAWASALLPLATLLVPVLAYALVLPQAKPGARITMRHYSVNLTDLLSAQEVWGLEGVASGERVLEAAEQLATSFIQLEKDAETKLYLRELADATTTLFGRFKARVSYFLLWSLQYYLGWSRPDASGFVGNSLYVASEKQFELLLARAMPDLDTAKRSSLRLLDVGSGRATETQKLTAVLEIGSQNVTCVETSERQRAAVRSKGFNVSSSLAFDEIGMGQPSFAVAALLNVLDRCDEPAELLNSTLNLLSPDGILLIASVLPFTSFVHEGRKGVKWGKPGKRRPKSPLALPSFPGNQGFERQAAALLAGITMSLQEHGRKFEVGAWARLPYLSSGNFKKTHFVLDMSLMALRVKSE